jgi:integrase
MLHADHFVFPHERYGASGEDKVFGFTQSTVYDLDPTRPTGSVKVAWEQARKRAGLPGIRLHDLRHTGVSRMIANRVPLPIIGKIVGWSAGTLAKMAARYGHFSLDEQRTALESIGRKEPSCLGSQNSEVSSGYPKKSPKSEASNDGVIQ